MMSNCNKINYKNYAVCFVNLNFENQRRRHLDVNFTSFSLIPFNQENNLLNKLDSNFPTLQNFHRKYDGLCELVCNRVLIDDLLGKADESNFLQINVDLEKINDQKIKHSHILNVYSIFRRALAYLFGIYPDNIFSCFDQWKLVNRDTTDNKIRVVNRTILSQGLESIEDGEILKLEVFKKKGLNLHGHSLLIKKISRSKYIFFDPNNGEHRNLSITKLSDKIDQQLSQWEATDLLIMRGKVYLKRLDNSSDA